jgi:hypothetical protein
MFLYPECFEPLTGDELLAIDGGTVWGVVAGVFGVIAGVATIVGGVALLMIPEPTTLTKFAGGAAIGTGVAAVLASVAGIVMNW